MNKQHPIADNATDTMEEIRDLMRKQFGGLRAADVTESVDQMVGRVEDRFGYSREDAMKSVKTLFDSYGDDILNLIAEKTPLPVRRKKQNRNKKLITALTIAIGVIAVTRWFVSYSGDES